MCNIFQGLGEVESREGSICVVHTGGEGVGYNCFSSVFVYVIVARISL